MSVLSILRPWFGGLVGLFFPRCCPVCGGRLVQEDECVCLTCMAGLPRTGYHLKPGNRMEQRFYGIVPIERAAAYYHYSPQSPYSRIVYRIKYLGDVRMGIFMGRCMAGHLMKDGTFLQGIDRIVPVPLSVSRLRERGYNQSLLLAQGISEVSGIPIDETLLRRVTDNPTQTRLSGHERWENVEGIFDASGHTLTNLCGKHFLLVDDVATTGATLANCALALHQAIPACKVSLLSLALADGGG